MKTNLKMKQYLDSLVKTEYNFTINLKRIENIIFPKFFDWDGCVLLSQDRNNELQAHFTPNPFVTDRTAFEAGYNHIHLNDYLDDDISADTILNIGIKILEVWAAVLYKQYKGSKNFMLILAYDGEEVILRFFTVRKNEVPWLDLSKLEEYLDGILLIEV